MNEITTFEAAQLEQYEATIKTGLASFIEVGEALTKIRDRKLYRATHGTFEEYCQKKWKMNRNNAYLLMRESEAAKSVSDLIQPNREQARALLRIEPSNRKEVVERAVADTGGKITAAALKEAAQTIEMTPANPKAQKFHMPARGLFIARGTISELETILPNDPERTEAITLVLNWCQEHLS